MIKVSVYYNDNVMAMFQGYHKEDPVKYVTMLTHKDEPTFVVAEYVMAAMQEPDNLPTVRSMCTGDVVRMHVDGLSGSIWLACAMQGFVLIDQPNIVGTWSR